MRTNVFSTFIPIHGQAGGCLGHVLSYGRQGWRAYGADGERCLGFHPTQGAAIEAVLRAAREAA